MRTRSQSGNNCRGRVRRGRPTRSRAARARARNRDRARILHGIVNNSERKRRFKTSGIFETQQVQKQPRQQLKVQPKEEQDLQQTDDDVLVQQKQHQVLHSTAGKQEEQSSAAKKNMQQQRLEEQHDKKVRVKLEPEEDDVVFEDSSSRSESKDDSAMVPSTTETTAAAAATATDYVASLAPTQEELEEATTNRKKTALNTFYKRLKELYSFREKYGHTKVPQAYPPNRQLGYWVNKMRMQIKSFEQGRSDCTMMTWHRLHLLEEAGFERVKSRGQRAWEHRFKELLEYKRQNKNCNVPTKYQANKALGRWVSSQRSTYKKFHQYQQKQKNTATSTGDDFNDYAAFLKECSISEIMNSRGENQNSIASTARGKMKESDEKWIDRIGPEELKRRFARLDEEGFTWSCKCDESDDEGRSQPSSYEESSSESSLPEKNNGDNKIDDESVGEEGENDGDSEEVEMIERSAIAALPPVQLPQQQEGIGLNVLGDDYLNSYDCYDSGLLLEPDITGSLESI